jgi:hypothetical protein
MSKKRDVAEILNEIYSKPIDYYPEDAVPPLIESPLDSAKYDNDDDSLDDVLSSNGGHFRVSNAAILSSTW